MDRAAAAKIGGIDRQSAARLGSSLQRFGAGGPHRQPDGRSQASASSAEKLAQLAKIVEAGPEREKDGIVRGRRVDLKRVIAERFGVDFHPRYVGKLLQPLGFLAHQRPARHPAQDERIVEGFKKTSRARRESPSRRLSETTPIVEIWFQARSPDRPEEWPRPPVWPGAERDQDSPRISGYDNAYLFGVIWKAQRRGVERPWRFPMPIPT